MTRIRPLAQSDCEGVLKINSDSLPGVARLDDEEYERLLQIPNVHIALEGANGAVIGYALAFASDAPYDGEEFLFLVNASARPFIYIDQVAVETTSRRTGIATLLYEALETYARGVAIEELCCEVNLKPPNAGSPAFHQTAGFDQIGVLETADGRTVVLMRKPLRDTQDDTGET